MNKITRIFGKTSLIEIIFFGGLTVLTLPSIFIYWMLVDDGYDLLIVKNLTSLALGGNLSAIVNIVVESQLGRFRPFYWIYNWAVYLIGGTEPSIHRIFHIALYILTAFIIYKVAHWLTKSKPFSLVGSAVFALSLLNLENLVRIGPVEPLLGLLLSLSIYFLIVKRNWRASSLFILLSFLTKETSIAIVPPIALLYLGERYIVQKSKNTQKILYTLIVGIISSAIVVLIVYLIRKGYGQYYVADSARMIDSIWTYLKLTHKNFSPFLEISLITFILSLARDLFRNKFRAVTSTNLYGVFFFLTYLSLIVIQSPWPYTLERYMLPALIFLSIFIALYMQKFWNFLVSFLPRKIKPLLFLGFGSYFIYFIVLNSISFWETSVATVRYTRNIKEMTSYLASNTGDGGTVYLNAPRGEHTIELLYEIGWHMNVFYDRQDIQVLYLDSLDSAEKDSLIVSGDFLKQFDEEALKEALGEPENFSNTDSNLIITTPVQIIKQLGKKIIKLLLYKEKINMEGIYTFYEKHNNWYVYKI